MALDFDVFGRVHRDLLKRVGDESATGDHAMIWDR